MRKQIFTFLMFGIAVEVYSYSDGSYLEDQDMWRLSRAESCRYRCICCCNTIP